MLLGLTPCPKLLPWLNREAIPRCLANYFFLKVLKTILSSIALASLALAPLSAEAKSRCGIASWYGPGFHGNRTANGERFNSQALTAASTRLPFGARIRVVNRDNGRSVVVRINDYGPVVPGRILDLSEKAFASIASTGQGLANICIIRV